MSDQFVIPENVRRMFALGHEPFLFIDEFKVNISDLLDLRPGRIVRCQDDPHKCIQIVCNYETHVECAAGWIGDDE